MPTPGSTPSIERPRRRRLTAAARRTRILDAAERLFADAGYAGASIDRIADAAGVSAPVIYDHFSSKRELFAAVMERARDELTARGAAVMSLDAPLEARVRAGIEAFFAYVEEKPAAARVLLVTHRGTAELQEAAGRVQAEATARLAALMSAEPGLFPHETDRERRLELVVEFVKQGMHGVAEWWADHPDVTREVVVDAVAEVVWSGLAAGLEPRAV
jgi:AcrR family transcriptional regulator